MSGANLTDYEIKLLSNVEEFGCHVTTVFDPDGTDPSFSYSAGFAETVEQGEVIVFGLDHDLMQRMINLTLDQCRNGLVLADGTPIEDLLDGFDVIARKIPLQCLDEEHFNSAMWFHRYRFDSELREAFQLVWPGAQQGLFPWQAGCDEFVINMQPPLYEKGSVH